MVLNDEQILNGQITKTTCHKSKEMSNSKRSSYVRLNWSISNSEIVIQLEPCRRLSFSNGHFIAAVISSASHDYKVLINFILFLLVLADYRKNSSSPFTLALTTLNTCFNNIKTKLK